jgi:nucleoside-diphosphate-sugar epimerase
VKRVLLSGATGFVGRCALERLRHAEVELHAVCRKRPKNPAPDVVWHEADLLNRQDIARVVEAAGADELLHLAWYAEPGAFWTSAHNMDWVASSLLLVRAFHERGGRRVVVSGTCAEYEWSQPTCVESATPLVPATLYGVAKDALRRILEAYAKQFGLSFGWGRIFFLYGPAEDPRRFVSSVISNLLVGRRTPTTAGTQLRDFMHVDDVAGGLVALLRSEVTGAVNIASGEAVRLKQVVDAVATRIGRHDLLDIGALPLRPNDPEVLLADVARLQLEVGFRPTRTLSQGLNETVAWWETRQLGDPR